jgi:curved DNA-binding protein
MAIEQGKRDHYRVLGVPVDASMPEIRRAYRRLVRQHHPDVSRQPGDGDYFTALTGAYEVLRDPRTRARYDQDQAQQRRDPLQDRAHRETPRWVEPTPPAGPGVDGSGPVRGRDRRAILELSEREAARLSVGAIVVHAGGYTIRVPAGSRAGEQLRLIGAGEPGSLGGPPGDLLLTLETPSATPATGASVVDLLFGPAASMSSIVFPEGRFVWH